MKQLDMFKQQDIDDKARALAEAELVHLQCIIDELTKIGIKRSCEVRPVNTVHKFSAIMLFPNGNICHDFRFEDMWSGSTWRSHKVGTAIVVGDYGSRRRYRPLKAGGYNYAGIAKAYVEYLTEQEAAQAARDKRKQTAATIAELKQELGFSSEFCSLNGFDLKQYEHTTDKIKISFSTSGDEEKARQVFKVLHDAGLI